MTKRTYPFKAWVLTPSMKPVEVELRKKVGWLHNYHEAASGKWYLDKELFGAKPAAIKAGAERLDAQQERITKMQATLDKKRAALAKHTTQ